MNNVTYIDMLVDDISGDLWWESNQLKKYIEIDKQFIVPVKSIVTGKQIGRAHV